MTFQLCLEFFRVNGEKKSSCSVLTYLMWACGALVWCEGEGMAF